MKDSGANGQPFQDENHLDPWVYVDEKEKHEIIDMTLSFLEKPKDEWDIPEMIENPTDEEQTEIELADEDADKMPLPKYF